MLKCIKCGLEKEEKMDKRNTPRLPQGWYEFGDGSIYCSNCHKLHKAMAYRFRIYPTDDQCIFLCKCMGCCRWIYNWALGRIKDAWEKDKKRLSIKDLSSLIPFLKKDEKTKWLGESIALSLIQELRHLESAFQNFFRRIKKGETPGYPKFKNKYKSKSSISFHQGYKIDIYKSCIYIPKLGTGIKVKLHRKIEGTPKTITITKMPSGKYYCSFNVETKNELPDKKSVEENTTTGIDLGCRSGGNNFVVFSDKKGKIEKPNFTEKLRKQLARAKRKLSRKVKGSNGYKEQLRVVNRIYEKIANQRNDFLNKASSNIINRNDTNTIAMEDLGIKDMLKQNLDKVNGKEMTNRKAHKFNLDINDASWYSFKQKIKYKAEWAGKNFLECDRYDATSKTCYCGYINKNLGDAKEWDCPRCGRHILRDELGSDQIKSFALKKFFENLDKTKVGAASPKLKP